MRPEGFHALGNGTNLALAAYEAEQQIHASFRARETRSVSHMAPCPETSAPEMNGAYVEKHEKSNNLWVALKRLLGAQPKPRTVEPAC